MTNFNHRFIETNGTRLYVVDEGDREGIPVLLLHGFPDSHKLWRAQIPALVSAGYRVIAPDLRGFGESELSDVDNVKPFYQENLAKDVIGLLDALELDKVHLVGHDFGGLLGWTIALTYPERLFQYTAISVGHPYAYAKLGGTIQLIKGWYTRIFKLKNIPEFLFSFANFKLFRMVSLNHSELETHWIPDMSREGRLTAALNWYRGASRLEAPAIEKVTHATIPVLGIWGAKDTYLSRQQMVQSSRFVDNTFQYVEIPAAGHWLPLDCPQKITELLITQIKRYTL